MKLIPKLQTAWKPISNNQNKTDLTYYGERIPEITVQAPKVNPYIYYDGFGNVATIDSNGRRILHNAKTFNSDGFIPLRNAADYENARLLQHKISDPNHTYAFANTIRKGATVLALTPMISPLAEGLGVVGDAAYTGYKALPWIAQQGLATGAKAGFAASGIHNFLGPEGYKKTSRLAKEGNYSKAALSAAGDLLDLSMVAPVLKAVPSVVSSANEGLNKVGRFMASPQTGKWTQFGNREYRFTPGRAYSGVPTIENRPVQLPESLKKLGWREEGGVAIKPDGTRWVRNAEGKLMSEESYIESSKTAAQQAAYKAAEEQKKEEYKRNLRKIISEFRKAGIDGFSVKELKARARGFNFSKKDIELYESFLPEYYEKFQELTGKTGKPIKLELRKGGWHGEVNGKMVPVNARHYIIANSKNFKENGWVYDPVNRGTAMFPETAPELQKNGGLDVANWATDNNAQLSKFSEERDHGPILRGLVSTRSNPDRILPVKYAHEKEIETYKGITSFDGGVEMNYNKLPEVKGNWKVYGLDMPIKSLDINNGLFSKTIKNPLSGFIPITIGGYTAYNVNK